jgi:hypothetical protein
MHRLYEGLNDYAECFYNDKESLDKIRLFYQQPGNIINANVEGAMKKFNIKAEALISFIDISIFDKWPYNQANSNFKIMLRPELLRNTQYRKSEPDDKMKWDNLFAELQKNICITKVLRKV